MDGDATRDDATRPQCCTLCGAASATRRFDPGFDHSVPRIAAWQAGTMTPGATIERANARFAALGPLPVCDACVRGVLDRESARRFLELLASLAAFGAFFAIGSPDGPGLNSLALASAIAAGVCLFLLVRALRLCGRIAGDEGVADLVSRALRRKLRAS